MWWPWCPRHPQLGDNHEPLAGTAQEEFANLRKPSPRHLLAGFLN
jgi:hypothetical protein